MQARAGMSKRLALCTPKKKNSVSISPAHRSSKNRSEPALAICRSHTLKQPVAISGTTQASHPMASVTRLSIPLNAVVMTASSRCLLVCSSALIASRTPGQPV